ncbi:MAG: endolytic transglycosylase MltG, partial [Spirulinaceae cyanobacterium]
MKVFKWFYYLIVLPIFLSFCALQGWSLFSWAISPTFAKTQSNSQTTEADETVQINVPAGTATKQIGQDLQAADLIKSSQAWQLWAWQMKLKEPTGHFKAGTYKVSPTESLPKIARTIWQGDVIQLKFTIPEGWTIKQMASYFESLGYFPSEDFVSATRQNPQAEYAWLPQDIPHLEGFLYPDTYQLASDRVTPEQVIEMMLKRFEEVALPIYQQGESKRLTFYQWLSLASIVEKEAVIDEERSTIAGVFINRLRQGMKLETDPTVEYGLNIQQTADQPLSFAQVKTPSPYN